MSIRVDFKQGNITIGSTALSRSSTGSVGGFKGTCAIHDRVATAHGNNVAKSVLQTSFSAPGGEKAPEKFARHMRKPAIVVALLISSSGAFAESIPDAPIQAIEPGLALSDRLGGPTGWLDEHTLLTTALINSKSQFWERRVVRVDARTGEAKDVANPGALRCTNPTEGFASLMAGSQEAMFTGNSKQPPPQEKLYSWNALLGILHPKVFTEGWSTSICKMTKPVDLEVPGTGFIRKDIRYLEAKDGHLAFTTTFGHLQEPIRRVNLVREGKTVVTLDVKQNDIAPLPQYLPFRGEYLLTSGQFVSNSVMTRTNEEPTTEHPMLLMTKSGQIKREYTKAVFLRRGLAVDGVTMPYAQGSVIFVSSRPRHGGGIYLLQGALLQRVWCTSEGNAYDRQCRFESVALSPDGCRIAFYVKGSDNPKAPYSYEATLKILPLCK